MVSVPPFLLRRLYVRGSLRNNSHGLEFQLLNKLGTGYARRVLPVSVDGQEFPLESCAFSVDGTQVPFPEVSAETPFTLDMNRATTVTVAGPRLTSEPHTIDMAFEVAGLGVLHFDFTDVPSDE